MTTTDQVLLIVLTSLLSIFFIICIVAAVAAVKLIAEVRKIIVKAENVVDSVESAAEVIKDTQGKLAIFKLVRNIVKLVQRSRR